MHKILLLLWINRNRITLKYAKSRGGECLASEWISYKDKLEWKCAHSKHKSWFRTVEIITKNSWCSKCAKEELAQKRKLGNGLELAQQIAKDRNGKCLSIEYKNANSKLFWKCSILSHKSWGAALSDIKKGRWCPECANESMRVKNTLSNGLELAQKLAKDKGGECLSTEYINSTTPMLWQCSQKAHNIWKATYHTVVNNNRWCPECAKFICYKESKVKKLLNYLLDTDFVKDKPLWDINPKTNKKLELDGYSENLKLAFEFQGLHHYHKVAYFKMDEKKVEYVKFKDKTKKENCEKNNVKLIIIDDIKESNTNEGLFNYVMEILNKEGIIINKKIDMVEVEEILNQMTNYQEEGLKKARDYAASRGGKCLSENYVNYHGKLEWKCNNVEHPSWFRSMSMVSDKGWCKLCGYERNLKTK